MSLVSLPGCQLYGGPTRLIILPLIPGVPPSRHFYSAYQLLLAMAEALGVASSIAGLISLAEVIVFKASRYCSFVKSARSDIRELLIEVQSLYGVLNSLKLLATCLEHGHPSSGTSEAPNKFIYS